MYQLKSAFARSIQAQFILLSTLILTACGGGGGGGNNNSPQVAPQAASTSFTASPGTLDFGKVVIGTVVEGVVVIENTGTTSFDIDLLDFGSAFTLLTDCGTIGPGEECALLIEFSPTEQTTYESSATLAANTEQQSLVLKGIGQGLNVELVGSQCVGGTLTVNISVTDDTGTPLLGINDGHISAMLNGAPLDLNQAVEENTERKAVSVGILLDWSGSLAEFQQALIDATTIFINSLDGVTPIDGEVDRGATYKFAQRLDEQDNSGFVVADDDGKTALIDNLYRDLSVGDNASVIWESVQRVAELLEVEPNESKVVILLSDGRDNDNGVSIADATVALSDRNITLYSIGFGDLDPTALQALAEDTGGLFYSDTSADSLEEAFDRITASLTNQYTLVFTVPDEALNLVVAVLDDSGREGEDELSLAGCP